MPRKIAPSPNRHKGLHSGRVILKQKVIDQFGNTWELRIKIREMFMPKLARHVIGSKTRAYSVALGAINIVAFQIDGEPVDHEVHE